MTEKKGFWARLAKRMLEQAEDDDRTYHDMVVRDGLRNIARK